MPATTPAQPAHARHAEGFLLSLVPVVLWGMLPVAISGVIDSVDGVTLTWLRFVVALLAQTLLLTAGPGSGSGLPWRHPPAELRRMLAVALGLVGNFALFATSLHFIPPSTGATLSQLQPIMLLMLGAGVLGRRLGAAQWIGAAAIVLGTVLFLGDRLDALVALEGGTPAGVGLALAGGTVWALGGLAQMRLAPTVPVGHLMWVVYASGTVLLAPLASPSAALRLEGLQWALLAFLCLNTIVAYASFSLALRRWELPRVSAVLATGVVYTYLAEGALHLWQPGLVQHEAWTPLKAAGAVLVVAGSLTTALAQPAANTGGAPE